jgi:hypothetical protein
MISVLKMIRDDIPSDDAVEVERRTGRWPYRAHHGAHRYYASRTLGFSHVPAELVEASSYSPEN